MASDVKTNLRLPEQLYQQIKQLADDELRSVNQQMVALLREAVEQRQQRKPSRPEQAQHE